MKSLVVALMILSTYPAFARQEESKPAPRPIKFFDVLDLPARVDEPTLQKTDGQYVLKCALANRSGEPLVGLRLALVFMDLSDGRISSRLSWNEATDIPAYSIKTFEFHPEIKQLSSWAGKTLEETNDLKLFLAVDEVISRDTVWRTIDADKMLRAYARGQHSLIPKVQTLQNKFDRTPAIVPSLPLPPPPKP